MEEETKTKVKYVTLGAIAGSLGTVAGITAVHYLCGKKEESAAKAAAAARAAKLLNEM